MLERYTQEAPEEFADSAQVCIEPTGDGNVRMYAYYERPETEVERANKEAVLRRRAEWEEAAERKEYIRLKKKYEGL